MPSRSPGRSETPRKRGDCDFEQTSALTFCHAIRLRIQRVCLALGFLVHGNVPELPKL